jgi:hypothetical protein
VTAETSVHDTLAGLFAAAAGHSCVPPGQAAAGKRVRSLEVRWIFPGRLTAAVAGWFGRFPARTESREDAYLLDPRWPGVSVKLRGGGPVEVKVYRGSPGILEVAGRAGGRLEAWQKWPLALRPPSPGSPEAAGWRPVRKRRRISRFSHADGQIVARAQQRAHEPGCEVELTEIRTSGQDWWTLGFEATGPVGLLRSQLQATAAHVFAQAVPGGVQPSPDHSRSYPQWLGQQPAAGNDAGGHQPAQRAGAAAARWTAPDLAQYAHRPEAGSPDRAADHRPGAR